MSIHSLRSGMSTSLKASNAGCRRRERLSSCYRLSRVRTNRRYRILIGRMARRLVATIALLVVFAAPIGALWCAYMCAFDDDSAPADASAAPVSPSHFQGNGAHQFVFSAHDDCAADVTNTARLAVVQGRVKHTVTLVASRAAAQLPTSIAHASAGHAVGLALSLGSPPGARSSSVLRI